MVKDSGLHGIGDDTVEAENIKIDYPDTLANLYFRKYHRG